MATFNHERGLLLLIKSLQWSAAAVHESYFFAAPPSAPFAFAATTFVDLPSTTVV